MRWLLLIPVVVFLSRIAFGSQLISIEVRGDVTRLYYGTIHYYEEYGEYPVTDAELTWFEKLVAEDEYRHNFESTIDGRYPVAPRNGSPYIYEPPAPGSPPDARPVFRWVGLNGIDENGAGDDIDIRYGINDGFYHKRNYPYARRVTAIGVMLLAIVSIAIWRLSRSDSLRVAVILIAAGILAIAVGVTGDDPRCWGCDGVYEFLPNIGAIATLLAFIPLGIHMARFWAGRRARLEFCCVRCGYDLQGVASDRCSECGALRKSEGAEST